jgi:hypothetical protein
VISVDEQVAVVVNGTGEPIGFKWRNSSFLVANKPMRWFARRSWWKEAARVQRGIGTDVIEVEMWRLMASDLHQKSCLQYELIHAVGKNDWRLILVYP